MTTPETDEAPAPPNQTRPYQVVLYVGSNPPSAEGVKVVDLTPRTGPPSVSALERLADAQLTTADMRARVLFVADTAGIGTTDLLACYAVACAFANRRLDAVVDTATLIAADIDGPARLRAEVERPSEVADWVQVGADHPDITTLGRSGALDASEIPTLRYARRVRLVPPADPVAALAQFLVISAVRARGPLDRFPIIVQGDEPAATDDTGVVGLDLDELRAATLEQRRTRRSDDRSAIVPSLPLTDRQRSLLIAAATPVEATLLTLGASTPDGEVWHCPRPERHTNGDATPSMRVSEGAVRCFRCDAERVDSLRLVMDTKGLTADEAAVWIAAQVDPDRSPVFAPA